MVKDILRDLVAINTIEDKDNHGMMDYLESFFNPLGFTVERKKNPTTDKEVLIAKYVPHIFVLLFCITLICSVLSWIIPAGSFERVVNETGREVVVAGTWAATDSMPIMAPIADLHIPPVGIDYVLVDGKVAVKYKRISLLSVGSNVCRWRL